MVVTIALYYKKYSMYQPSSRVIARLYSVEDELKTEIETMSLEVDPNLTEEYEKYKAKEKEASQKHIFWQRDLRFGFLKELKVIAHSDPQLYRDINKQIEKIDPW